MLLTIRVTLTILFSAFVLWSQTPVDAGGEASNIAADLALSSPSVCGMGLISDQPTFKLDMRESRSDFTKFDLAGNSAPAFSVQAASSQAPSSRPRAFTYGNGYLVRQKIHKYASIATLPLFVSEAIVGQKLFDRAPGEGDSLRSAHSALAAGIGVLFGVNSVTGVWNMWEARKDPNGRGKRMFHGILMLAADAGFVATAATAPHRKENAQGVRVTGDASTHRAVAFASFGVATVAYVYMLFAR